jgi:hypothetical protein
MKLKAAARRFDKTTAADAYDPLVTFKCQIEPFDFYKIDGSTSVKRRIMSVAPGTVIPARRVILVGDQYFLVGTPGEDFWRDETIRNNYIIQGADFVVTVYTLEEFIAGDPGFTAYASIDFSKYAVDERDSSQWHPQYRIFFGNTEPITEYSVVESDGTFYLVRNASNTVSGILDARSNRIDGPVVDAAVFSAQTYDPISDSYTSTGLTVRCIRLRWQEHFEYLSVASEKFKAGDMQVLLPLSVTPKAGDRITLSDGEWVSVAVVTQPTYHMVHVRRWL